MGLPGCSRWVPVGWLIPDPDLRADETVLARRLANLTIDNVAVGGRLYFTTSNVRFAPSRLNLKRHTRQRSWPLSHIASVDVRRDGIAGLNTAGLRRRLCLRLTEGQDLAFVVNDVDAVADELRALVVELVTVRGRVNQGPLGVRTGLPVAIYVVWRALSRLGCPRTRR